MNSKVNNLNVDRLVPNPVDLSKLSDVVKYIVVQEDVYNAKIKNIEDKISDITNAATQASLNAKINEVKGETSNVTNLMITNDLSALSVSNLVKKLTITQNLMTRKRKLLIIITTNILRLQNLIIFRKKFLI